MKTSSTPIGIDALSFDIPVGYIDLSDLAKARGIPPEKYLSGLGVRQMAVAQRQEDPVTLAANAARRLLHLSNQDPNEIGLCIVGTETAVDHAKPISSFLHHLLGLPSSCRVFEAKHACFGGTAGILTAIDWIASGSAHEKKALVVCTDIARYPLETAGEPTQGAGAVALLISQHPRILTIKPGHSGSYSRDVYDFWRPLYRKDALTDGHFSVQCYLEALTGAYNEWKTYNPNIHQTQLARTCYHVPYGKMAKKAHRHRLLLDGKTEQEAETTFIEEVNPSLDFPSQVGNIYTGSLYLALSSLLFHQAEELQNQQIGLFSYGSGCTAEFFSGQVQKDAIKMVNQLQLAQPLVHRKKLSIPEYEEIRKGDDIADVYQASSQTNAPNEKYIVDGKHMGPPRFDKKVLFLGLDEAERRVYQNEE